jgi:hypothetical protein
MGTLAEKGPIAPQSRTEEKGERKKKSQNPFFAKEIFQISEP